MRQVFFSGLNYFRQRTGFQWGGGEIIVAGILIFGILSMGSGMFGKWMRASREGGLLMVDLHSFSSADYGVDQMPVSVPAIGLEIIQDLLGMHSPPETGRPGGIALVTPQNPTPTPTLPFYGTQTPSSTPVVTASGGKTPTSQPRNSATPVVMRTSTPTVQEPVATNPPQEPSPTKIPTATPTVRPTNTSQPPSTSPPEPNPATPTNPPPEPSPTPPPAGPPTPRPTRSSTLAVTPTAEYTPVVSPGPPIIP